MQENLWAELLCFISEEFLIFLSGRALIAFAIRITPVFKWLFFFTALLPMSLYEGMSLSADSFNNAFAFLFFAYIFKLIFEKKELERQDYALLVSLSVLSAFTKGGIYPVFLSFFCLLKSINIYLHCHVLGLRSA